MGDRRLALSSLPVEEAHTTRQTSSVHDMSPPESSHNESSVQNETPGSINSQENSDVLPFRCHHHDCGARFRQPCYLTDHITRKHVKRYKCSEHGCNQTFHLRADMTRHAQTHSAPHTSQAFTCLLPNCDRTFGRKDNMLRHVKRSHRATSN
ncbi:hypothetical protein CC86DRAFT_193381 [Ophiobolus disseminans]|uniref:C2H2-type domain-containing protein n=1 Tax=Ophiobolus disseminans TaxID=1469910 RepID=A0A6A7A564_9PLEO|nr:hypothetical protein CC86DRAFT_193381 [Ophiobolus disseminans]